MRPPNEHLRSTTAITSAPSTVMPRPSACDDELITELRLSRRWDCSPKTLRNQRSLGEGCPYILLGRLVRYRLSDVLAYEAAHAQRSNKSVGGAQ
jgi:hypothetical protein